ncbi:MAG: glycosyltransferase [Planctomycetota bacterium]
MATQRRPDLISVIVATRDGAQRIDACLRALLTCRVPAGFEREVIVVDDGSRDDTSARAARHAGVRVLTRPPEGPSAARNAGILAAGGEAIAFTDDDCEVDAAWLVELVGTLRATDAAAAGGAQVVPSDDVGLAREIGRFLLAVGFAGGYTRRGNALRDVDHNPTCCSIYRTSALLAIGGFARDLWPGEDVELDRRIAQRGWRIVYTPRARVAHHRVGTLRSFARMLYRYGRWSTGYLTRQLGLFRALCVVPAATLALGAAWCWAALEAPLAALALVVIALSLACRTLLRGGLSARDLPLHLGLAALGGAAWHIGFARGILTGRPLVPGLAAQPSAVARPQGLALGVAQGHTPSVARAHAPVAAVDLRAPISDNGGQGGNT